MGLGPVTGICQLNPCCDGLICLTQLLQSICDGSQLKDKLSRKYTCGFQCKEGKKPNPSWPQPAESAQFGEPWPGEPLKKLTSILEKSINWWMVCRLSHVEEMVVPLTSVQTESVKCGPKVKDNCQNQGKNMLTVQGKNTHFEAGWPGWSSQLCGFWRALPTQRVNSVTKEKGWSLPPS